MRDQFQASGQRTSSAGALPLQILSNKFRAAVVPLLVGSGGRPKGLHAKSPIHSLCELLHLCSQAALVDVTKGCQSRAKRELQMLLLRVGSSIWLLCGTENLAGDAKGKGASGSNREAESTDAPERGGGLHWEEPEISTEGGSLRAMARAG
jgi:hypothetical protein